MSALCGKHSPPFKLKIFPTNFPVVPVAHYKIIKSCSVLRVYSDDFVAPVFNYVLLHNTKLYDN